MEINLPSTLTARYEQWVPRLDGAPGAVLLEFGGHEVAEIRVTEEQHKRLTAAGFWEAEEYRERALCSVVAAWLGARFAVETR